MRGAPIAAAALAEHLRSLGLVRGDVVLVHTALSKVAGGRLVLGGPVAVIEALQRVLGFEGTLAMPAFSASWSEPRRWTNPPVPEGWWPAIRAGWPAYHPARTPTFRIGVVPEVFRAFDGVHRSAHPQCSFCAWGAGAEALTAAHPLDDPLGDGSPLGALERRGAKGLLLGAGWGSCTAFHLGEMRAAAAPGWVEDGAAMWVEGERRWVRFRCRDADADDFPRLGRDFEASGAVRRARVGEADARLFALLDAASFAERWIDRHR
ncbi:MAG: AAC(3) family N-acetyltransferase [Sandaracinus sp.]|nr:AAC(3) family N-acetyltransferase [Sandaracinus sp.]